MGTLSTMKWVYLKSFFIFPITKEIEKKLKNFKISILPHFFLVKTIVTQGSGGLGYQAKGDVGRDKRNWVEEPSQTYKLSNHTNEGRPKQQHHRGKISFLFWEISASLKSLYTNIKNL